MRYKWLKQGEGSQDVIVFFNGWGLNEQILAELTPSAKTDLLFVYDYTSLKTDLPQLQHYRHRTLIAWSFGVGSYALWQQNHSDIFTRKIAINGTPNAIDRHLGIAAKVVKHTIDTLTIDSFCEFVLRCYNNEINDHLLNALVNHVDIDARKQELINICNRHYSGHVTSHWDSIFISKTDTIFPYKNQLRAWSNTPIKIHDTPHAPFAKYLDWQFFLTT